MNNFVQSLIDGLDKTTEAGFAEALLIAIANLKNEQGLLLNIRLSDDFNQQIDFAKQIARMMVKEKNI
jgi:spore coat protein CotF